MSLAVGPTHLVTFFLRPEARHHEHKGSFGSSVRTDASGRRLIDAVDLRDMERRVDQFVARSAALCEAGVEVHVVHNLNTSSATMHRQRVTYHADPPAARRGQMPSMPIIDQRFWLLQRLLLGHGASWKCVFAVDLTDVDVLRVPRCDAFPRVKLLIASDSCGDGVKRWVRIKGEDAGFNGTWDDGFRAFLRGGDGGGSSSKAVGSVRQPTSCIWNCGIIGGGRQPLLRALRYVVRRLATVWSQPLGSSRLAAHALKDPVGDMVAWNEYCYAHADELVTGYPNGPLNLPMYGHLMRSDLECKDPAAAEASEPRAAAQGCAMKWHSASAGRYYFGHKLPGWVRWMHLPQHCRQPQPAGASLAASSSHASSTSSKAALDEWRRRGLHKPLPQCTLQLCTSTSDASLTAGLSG